MDKQIDPIAEAEKRHKPLRWAYDRRGLFALSIEGDETIATDIGEDDAIAILQLHNIAPLLFAKARQAERMREALVEMLRDFGDETNCEDMEARSVIQRARAALATETGEK